jgi:hypothetical protein
MSTWTQAPSSRRRRRRQWSSEQGMPGREASLASGASTNHVQTDGDLAKKETSLIYLPRASSDDGIDA